MELSLQNQLVLIPLFQGMSKSELTQVIGQTKLRFLKFAKGKTIKQENDPCDQLMFLINGEIDMITFADDRSYSVEEHFAPPYTLQMEHFFGLTQRYTHTFIARTTCHFVSIDKNDMLKLTDDYIIFRMNLINIISTCAQKAQRTPWRFRDTGTRQQIIRFFEERCSKPAGHKTVRIKIAQLAAELHESRLNVSQELNKMRSEGLLNFTRGIIDIPNFETLKAQESRQQAQ